MTADERWAAYDEPLSEVAAEIAAARALERSPDRAMEHLHAARARLNDAERLLVVVLYGAPV